MFHYCCNLFLAFRNGHILMNLRQPVLEVRFFKHSVVTVTVNLNYTVSALHVSMHANVRDVPATQRCRVHITRCF